jgi:hypothetical protein
VFPSLRDDMTIYSLVAATQRLRADSNAVFTGTALFGRSGAGLRHDFPSNLSSFSYITGGAYGDALELALNHTVLPYFTAFRPPDVLQQCVAMMAGPSVERLKFCLGLPASHMGASMPLGYCPACLQGDQEDAGFGYWHRNHQIPGVLVCPIHGEIVRRTRIRTNGIGKTRLFLPDDTEIRADAIELVLPTEHQRDTLAQIARLSQCALNNNLPGPFDPNLLQECYRFGLSQQGWLTAGGSIRATNFIHAIVEYFRAIAHIAPFNRVISAAGADAMLCLVRKPRNRATTLAHLLLINFLFGDWARFASAYQWQRQHTLPFDAPKDVMSGGVCAVSDELDITLRRIATAYRNGEQSLSALCEMHHVSLDTVMRWLGRLGLADVARRPRVMTADVRKQAESFLREGRSQKEVCTLLSLSKATVDRVLNSSESLYRSWKQNHHGRRREIERNNLECFINSHPGTTMGEIRSRPGIGYSWLSRHDRAWLKKRVPAAARSTKAKNRRRPVVDWSSRDAQCLEALKIVAANLEIARHEIIAPPAILRRLPALPFKPQLTRLPTSNRFVETLLNLLRARRSCE